MVHQTRNDLRINGNGSISGGKYNDVIINGMGKVDGDIDCIKFRCNGDSKVSGSIKSNKNKRLGKH